MKKKSILTLLAVSGLIIASCASKKPAPDYDKVDKAYEEYKERNPDQ